MATTELNREQLHSKEWFRQEFSRIDDAVTATFFVAGEGWAAAEAEWKTLVESLAHTPLREPHLNDDLEYESTIFLAGALWASNGGQLPAPLAKRLSDPENKAACDEKVPPAATAAS